MEMRLTHYQQVLQKQMLRSAARGHGGCMERSVAITWSSMLFRLLVPQLCTPRTVPDPVPRFQAGTLCNMRMHLDLWEHQRV